MYSVLLTLYLIVQINLIFFTVDIWKKISAWETKINFLRNKLHLLSIFRKH